MRSEYVEVLGGSRCVDNSHVDLLLNFADLDLWLGRGVVSVRELQKALNSGGRVLWAIAVESVRQEHNKAVLDVPLGLA